MKPASIDLAPLSKAIATLAEAIAFWQAQAEGSVLQPHLCSAVVQSFEFGYEPAVRTLRRVLIERSEAADLVADLSFSDLLRKAADPRLVLAPARRRMARDAQ